jgi:hypothetical protein
MDRCIFHAGARPERIEPMIQWPKSGYSTGTAFASNGSFSPPADIEAKTVVHD